MKAVRGILLANTAVTVIVGTGTDARVFPHERIQTSDLPAITLKNTENEPSRTKSGASSLDVVVTEVTSYGSTYEAAETLSKAVRSALDRVAAQTMNGEVVQAIDYLGENSDFFEIKNKPVHYIEQDYQIRIEV